MRISTTYRYYAEIKTHSYVHLYTGDENVNCSKHCIIINMIVTGTVSCALQYYCC